MFGRADTGVFHPTNVASGTRRRVRDLQSFTPCCFILFSSRLGGNSRIKRNALWSRENDGPFAELGVRGCATIYEADLCGNRLPATNPTDTAGFKWLPEMWPIANAIASTVSPKASATAKEPMPRPGNAAARTALPHPPKTNLKVPKNAAAARLPIVVSHLEERDSGH